ncbi:MAG: hypothetical protein ACRC92_17680 [Peptostreptococcaceae bacterium]
MTNLIKADLYRLFRSKTYKSCIIGCLGITAFVLGLAIFTDVELWLMAFTGKDGLRRGFLIGLQQNASFRELVINALGSGAGLYIVGITLTTSVIVSKVRSGVMKNTVSYGYERWKIYLSQMISLIIGISALMVSSFTIILLITYVVFMPSNIGYEGIILAVKSLIVYIVIVAATVSIYTLLATLVSNSEVMGVIAIVEMLGVAMIGPSLSTQINNWIPYSMIRTLAQVPDNINFITYLLSGLIIIVISTSLGILAFNKREIK